MMMVSQSTTRSKTPVVAATAGRKLLAYCYKNNWAGYDPYDALNSRIITALPLMQSRFPALVATQALKRSFLNVRGALQVPKTQNPKALALFISAILRAPQFAPDNSRELLDQLCERLEALRSPGASYWCWGYSFPWQGRSLLVPRWTPNLVCTSFAATAYLDLYSA